MDGTRWANLAHDRHCAKVRVPKWLAGRALQYFHNCGSFCGKNSVVYDLFWKQVYLGGVRGVAFSRGGRAQATGQIARAGGDPRAPAVGRFFETIGVPSTPTARSLT